MLEALTGKKYKKIDSQYLKPSHLKTKVASLGWKKRPLMSTRERGMRIQMRDRMRRRAKTVTGLTAAVEHAAHEPEHGPEHESEHEPEHEPEHEREDEAADDSVDVAWIDDVLCV